MPLPVSLVVIVAVPMYATFGALLPGESGLIYSSQSRGLAFPPHQQRDATVVCKGLPIGSTRPYKPAVLASSLQRHVDHLRHSKTFFFTHPAREDLDGTRRAINSIGVVCKVQKISTYYLVVSILTFVTYRKALLVLASARRREARRCYWPVRTVAHRRDTRIVSAIRTERLLRLTSRIFRRLV